MKPSSTTISESTETAQVATLPSTPGSGANHWQVITRGDWPAIQAKGQDDPLIVFADDTALGSAAASRWAALICSWMNEQMRLGLDNPEPQRCDAVLLAKLRETEKELEQQMLDNHDLCNRLIRVERANRHAAAALRSVPENGTYSGKGAGADEQDGGASGFQ